VDVASAHPSIMPTKSQEIAKMREEIVNGLADSGGRVYNGANKSCRYMRGKPMKISYKKLWILLIERDISPATLRKDLSIATGTMTKLRRDEEVALSVLLRICEYLHCDIGDICSALPVEQDFAWERGEA